MSTLSQNAPLCLVMPLGYQGIGWEGFYPDDLPEDWQADYCAQYVDGVVLDDALWEQHLQQDDDNDLPIVRLGKTLPALSVDCEQVIGCCTQHVINWREGAVKTGEWTLHFIDTAANFEHISDTMRASGLLQLWVVVYAKNGMQMPEFIEQISALQQWI